MTSASAKAATDKPQEPLLQPWQFFLLGGMLAATATVIVATGQSPANIIVLSLTVVSVSFVGLGAYRTFLPLVASEIQPPATVAGRTRLALEREKTLVLRSIKEAEFDLAMRKLSKEDFDEVSSRLRQRAFRLMQQLDAGGGYRDSIENEVQRRLEGDGSSRRQPGQDERARADSVGADEAQPASARTCECGTVNDPDARFCKSCGAKL